jgi:hypothetical protein
MHLFYNSLRQARVEGNTHAQFSDVAQSGQSLRLPS